MLNLLVNSSTKKKLKISSVAMKLLKNITILASTSDFIQIEIQNINNSN